MKEKILVFTKNWLGDVIFETPALRAIKKNFPESELVCIAPKRCAEILDKNPFVDRTINFDERREDRGLMAKLRLISFLRKERFTKAFLFHRSFTRALIVYLGGISERYGYATKGRSFLLTQAVNHDENKEHHRDYFLNLLREVGLKVDDDISCEFYFDLEDERKIKNILSEKNVKSGNLVVLNPGANWPPKRWPAAHFAKLAELLIKKYDVNLVLTGYKEDNKLIGEILGNMRSSQPVSLCGMTSLGELGALFSSARLVISGDSGPLHIASGVGANILAIFGPTNPDLTGPRGKGKSVVIHELPDGCDAPCFDENCTKNICMISITPEKVVETIEREKLLG